MHPDDEVLISLAQHGSDLSAPHTLEYYFYFKNASVASEACTELEARGFTILRNEPAAEPNLFLLLASISLVPERHHVIALSDQLEMLARKFGGTYDGWEAAIVRRTI